MTKQNEDWYEKERLHRAAGDGDPEQVKDLLAAGYPVNAFDDALSRTPLQGAVIGNHPQVVRFLLQAGADVNAHEENRIGNTVLRDIAENCSLQMAEILVAAGADPTIPGWMQLTALDTAKKRKTPEGQKVHRRLCEAAKRFNAQEE